MFKTNYFSYGSKMFKRGHYEEHLCESNMNLDQWFRRYNLKTFLFLALVAILFSSGTVCAFWVEGIIRDISVTLF